MVKWTYYVIGLLALTVLVGASSWTRPNIISASIPDIHSGNVTLVAGTTIIPATFLKSTTQVFITAQTGIVNLGTLSVTTKNVGSNFTILSTNILDSSNVAWMTITP